MVASPSDDLSPAELGDSLGRKTQHVAKDLLIVLAESGRKAERWRLADRRAWQRDPEPGARVGDLDYTLGDEWVGHHLVHGAHARDRNPRAAQCRERLVARKAGKACRQL